MGAASAEALAEAGFALMLAGRREEKLEETRARVLEKHPDAKVEIRATDVADPAECEALVGVIAYLATEAPEFLTGSTLYVDGGQTAIAPVP